MKQYRWLKHVSESTSPHQIREIFHHTYGLILIPEVHNLFFERIYQLRNASLDHQEIKLLDELRDDIEIEMEHGGMNREVRLAPPQKNITIPTPKREHEFILLKNFSFDDTKGTIEAVEKEIIIKALEHFEGNRQKTAEAVGVSVRTLRNKLNQYRLETNGNS